MLVPPPPCYQNRSIKLASDSDCDTPVSKDRTSGTMKDPDLAAIHACITQCYAQRASDPTAALVASIQQRARRRKQKNRLILVKAKLGSVQVTCLVDSGAEASLVSEAVQRAAGLKTTPGEKLLVQGWDGSQRECGRVLRNISLVAGEYSGQHTFVVAPLEGSFDVILGNDWLHANAEAYKVHTDRGMVELHQRNGIVARLYAIDSPESKTYASASAATVERWKKQDEIEDCVQVSLRWASDEEEDLVAKPLEPDIRTDEEKRAAIEKMRVDLDGVKKKHMELVLKGVIDGLPPDREATGGNFKIDLKPGAEASKQAPYRMSAQLVPELDRQLADMMARGYIRHSTSEFGAPVLFVKKKNGEWRLCVDYRDLNSKTIKDRFPLPRIDDLLDTLDGAAVFTSLDAVQGYHQCRIRAEDVHKTAFRTQYGHFEYLVLPFGLANAPAHFQRYMNRTFREAGLLGVTVLVYIDDILIFSADPAEHAKHVDAALQVVADNHVICNPAKCHFGLLEVEFLGHIVSAEGIRADPKKVAAIVDWPEPRNVTEVKSFMGAVNFHRRHIENCARLAAPLNDLMKKDKAYVWGEDQQDAFDALKHALVTAPVLRAPVFGADFVLYTDASGTGMGAALYQEFGEDGPHPIAYWSRCFTPAELNYMTTDQELCAIVNAIKAFQHYLRNASVTALTDHQALTTFLTKKTLKETSRHVRWADYLAEFELEIKHLPGNSNVVADALSRKGFEQVTVTVVVTPTAGAGQRGTFFRAALEAACAADEYIQAQVAALKAGKLSRTKYHEHAGLLYRRYGSHWCLVVPHSQVQMVLREMHDAPTAGHMGVERTATSVRRLFWWSTLAADVIKYVGSCPSCQRTKPHNHPVYGTLQPVPVPKTPWEVVNMDFFGPFPADSAGFDYAMSVTDRFTKMLHIIPCQHTLTAKDAASMFINVVFRYHGMPKGVVSDRDAKFTSLFWRELMSKLDTSLLMSTAMHPQTDGLAERQHRTIEETLTNWTAARPTDWSAYVPLVEFAINNSKQAATGDTPFFLNYGQHPRTPLAIVADSLLPAELNPASADYLQSLQTAWKCAHKSIEQAQRKMKERADQHRRPSPFKVGDKVSISRKVLSLPDTTDRKLQYRFYGPFTVKALRGPNAVY